VQLAPNLRIKKPRLPPPFGRLMAGGVYQSFQLLCGNRHQAIWAEMEALRFVPRLFSTLSMAEFRHWGVNEDKANTFALVHHCSFCTDSPREAPRLATSSLARADAAFICSLPGKALIFRACGALKTGARVALLNKFCKALCILRLKGLVKFRERGVMVFLFLFLFFFKKKEWYGVLGSKNDAE